jgi:hypothetical protein
VQLSLTPKGHEVHRETTETLNAVLLPRLAALAPGELETFLAIVRKIIEPISPVGQGVRAGAVDDEAAPRQSAAAKARRAT